MLLDFSQALLNAEAPVPAGIVDPKGAPAPRRFAVYRNNVTTSLVDALGATFPAVMAMVGEGFFKQMARVFIAQSPPNSPLLTEYGRDFADFLEGFQPVQSLSFLPDVARLDRAWLDAYHGADAVPLAPEQLAAIDQDALVQARFTFHPAHQLLMSQFPVADIWHAARAGEAAAGIDPSLRQSVLLTRPDIDVQVHSISPATGAFMTALVQGATLGEAAEAVLTEEEFDLGASLGLLISSGALVGVEI